MTSEIRPFIIIDPSQLRWKARNLRMGVLWTYCTKLQMQSTNYTYQIHYITNPWVMQIHKQQHCKIDKRFIKEENGSHGG